MPRQRRRKSSRYVLAYQTSLSDLHVRSRRDLRLCLETFDKQTLNCRRELALVHVGDTLTHWTYLVTDVPLLARNTGTDDAAAENGADAQAYGESRTEESMGNGTSTTLDQRDSL